MPRMFRKRLSPKVRRELGRREETTLLDHLRANRTRQVYLPGMAGLGEQVFSEAEQDAKAAEILRQAPPTELYDKSTMGGAWPKNVSQIPKVIQFHSRAGHKLVDIPVELREGVREEIVERYGVSREDADKLASQAIDRWIEMERRQQDVQAMPSYKAEIVQRSYVPAFSVESVPSNLGELSQNNEQIVKTYGDLGWKQIVPVALGLGLVVLLLKGR